MTINYFSPSPLRVGFSYTLPGIWVSPRTAYPIKCVGSDADVLEPNL
jgi:hypothetical protein